MGYSCRVMLYPPVVAKVFAVYPSQGPVIAYQFWTFSALTGVSQYCVGSGVNGIPLTGVDCTVSVTGALWLGSS